MPRIKSGDKPSGESAREGVEGQLQPGNRRMMVGKLNLSGISPPSPSLRKSKGGETKALDKKH